MKEIRVFLAHTEEVKDDVDKIQLTISKKYPKIDIKHWTDADKSLGKEGFQKRLNETIGTCEILYIFFENRIGKFTKEEFKYGLERFKNNQKPYKISIFSKKYTLDSDEASEEEVKNDSKVREFKKKIKNINGNQYLHTYTDNNDLKNQLIEQLEIDIEKVIEIQKEYRNNPSLSLIKFEGKCPEDIIPIAVKVLKQINDYIEEKNCFPCISVEYISIKKELSKIFEDETLQLSIKYLLSNSCIIFFKKEDLYGNQVEYIKLTTKGDDIIRLRYL